MLPLMLTIPGPITPRPGLWQVSSRLSGEGKILGDTGPPMSSEEKQCITAELWAKANTRPRMPPQCTILNGGDDKTDHRELNYACQFSPGRLLRVHMVTDVLSPESVRVEATQSGEANGTAFTTTNILTYTFLSDTCGAVQPAMPPTARQ